MPHTMISDDNTHVRPYSYRQHLMLLGLHVPYAHGVVPGARDDEAAVTREVEGDHSVFMSFKYGEDVLGRNVPYLRVSGANRYSGCA
jgi:hypothetical protein